MRGPTRQQTVDSEPLAHQGMTVRASFYTTLVTNLLQTRSHSAQAVKASEIVELEQGPMVSTICPDTK